MELFISWSGHRSGMVAVGLSQWVADVIQSVETFMSEEDIDKGRRWSAEISKRLGGTSQGLICVTPENQHAPWLNFEAGALAKAVEDSRVRPLLLDLSKTDLGGPLSEFQATELENREDMLALMKSINRATSSPLEDDRLERQFYLTWEDALGRFAEARASKPNKEGVRRGRTAEEKIDEVLERVRAIERELSDDLPVSFDTRISPAANTSRKPGGNNLEVGDMVRHTKFGMGKVVHAAGVGEERELTVEFEQVGRKQLVECYAPLQWEPF